MGGSDTNKATIDSSAAAVNVAEGSAQSGPSPAGAEPDGAATTSGEKKSEAKQSVSPKFREQARDFAGQAATVVAGAVAGFVIQKGLGAIFNGSNSEEEPDNPPSPVTQGAAKQAANPFPEPSDEALRMLAQRVEESRSLMEQLFQIRHEIHTDELSLTQLHGALSEAQQRFASFGGQVSKVVVQDDDRGNFTNRAHRGHGDDQEARNQCEGRQSEEGGIDDSQRAADESDSGGTIDT